MLHHQPAIAELLQNERNMVKLKRIVVFKTANRYGMHHRAFGICLSYSVKVEYDTYGTHASGWRLSMGFWWVAIHIWLSEPKLVP